MPNGIESADIARHVVAVRLDGATLRPATVGYQDMRFVLSKEGEAILLLNSGNAGWCGRFFCRQKRSRLPIIYTCLGTGAVLGSLIRLLPLETRLGQGE